MGVSKYINIIYILISIFYSPSAVILVFPDAASLIGLLLVVGCVVSFLLLCGPLVIINSSDSFAPLAFGSILAFALSFVSSLPLRGGYLPLLELFGQSFLK